MTRSVLTCDRCIRRLKMTRQVIICDCCRSEIKDEDSLYAIALKVPFRALQVHYDLCPICYERITGTIKLLSSEDERERS